MKKFISLNFSAFLGLVLLLSSCDLRNNVESSLEIELPNTSTNQKMITESVEEIVQRRIDIITTKEKDKRTTKVLDANKFSRKDDYTKYFLAFMRYSGLEWSIYATSNKKQTRDSNLIKNVLDNRFFFLECYKEPGKCYFLHYDPKLEKSKRKSQDKKIKFHAKSGHRKHVENTSISPLSKKKIGLDEDLFGIEFPHAKLGERNGALMTTDLFGFGHHDYEISKIIFEKISENTYNYYVKLECKKTGDLIYLKSEGDKQIKLNDSLEEYLRNLKVDRSYNSRLDKALFYSVTVLHAVFLLPLEFAFCAGVSIPFTCISIIGFLNSDSYREFLDTRNNSK